MGEQNLKSFDTIIIGGGIVGAGILRDIALHNQSALIIERGDFSSQTSQGSSKMLHGGIRYLENLDFALVHEALTEKNHWIRTAPHLAYEDRFYLPNYTNSKYPLWMVKIGLFLYDLLSLFRNTSHRVIGRKQTLKELPGIKPEGLKGAGIYSDGIIDDAKLALECIYCALETKGCEAINYTKVTKIQKIVDKDYNYHIWATDTLEKKEFQFKCKQVVFATGPFTDQVMKELNIAWEPVILPSKGTHLWLKEDSLPIESPIVLQTADMRIIFVIPQRGAILVGTTEKVLNPDENFFNIKPTNEEIEYLLKSVNEYFPNNKVQEKDIIASFAAIRPLVKESAVSTSGKTSRKHKIFQPMDNMYVIVGGKYTTFRRMAQSLVKIIFKKNHIPYDKNRSLAPLRRKSIVTLGTGTKLTRERLEQIIAQEKVRTSEDLIRRRLSLQDDSQLKEDQELNAALSKFR